MVFMLFFIYHKVHIILIKSGMAMFFVYKKICFTVISALFLIFSSNSYLAANQTLSSSSHEISVDDNPVFDDSTIFGSVYVDRNENGIRDNNEEGVMGVKLVTATGLIVTTDENGRYSLAGISGGRQERGTNFIIKLDKDSLPPQYELISQQVAVVRLSPGLPQRIDFRLAEIK